MGSHGDAPELPAADFDAFAAGLDYPMYIVTTRVAEQLAGCLVGFASQTSINPRRFLVCLSVANFTFSVAARARHLVVHTVRRDNLALARLFGAETGTEVDKFQWCAWHRGAHGQPILDEAAAWFVGEILERIDLGDHHGFLLAPIAAKPDPDATALVTFADVRDLPAGHEA